MFSLRLRVLKYTMAGTITINLFNHINLNEINFIDTPRKENEEIVFTPQSSTEADDMLCDLKLVAPSVEKKRRSIKINNGFILNFKRTIKTIYDVNDILLADTSELYNSYNSRNKKNHYQYLNLNTFIQTQIILIGSILTPVEFWIHYSINNLFYLTGEIKTSSLRIYISDFNARNKAMVKYDIIQYVIQRNIKKLSKPPYWIHSSFIDYLVFYFAKREYNAIYNPKDKVFICNGVIIASIIYNSNKIQLYSVHSNIIGDIYSDIVIYKFCFIKLYTEDDEVLTSTAKLAFTPEENHTNTNNNTNTINDNVVLAI
jgi:hypothetical protein